MRRFFWYDPRPGWDKDRFTRHIFALDHNYKLFSDGRLFDISGEGFREEPLDSETLSAEEKRGRGKAGPLDQENDDSSDLGFSEESGECVWRTCYSLTKIMIHKASKGQALIRHGRGRATRVVLAH